MELASQYLEVATPCPDRRGTVETELTLGSVPDGATLAVTAIFGVDLQATGTITLDCRDYYAGLPRRVPRGRRLRPA